MRAMTRSNSPLEAQAWPRSVSPDPERRQTHESYPPGGPNLGRWITGPVGCRALHCRQRAVRETAGSAETGGQ